MVKNSTICIVGLGYVGLPLAAAFSKKYQVIGYDKNKLRIKELNNFYDRTGEITSSQLKKIKSRLILTANKKKIFQANIYIVTVPTPVKNKIPDLKYLEQATSLISKNLKKNDYVIYESTVYPGVTEDLVKNILSKKTKFVLNKDFYVGYSPERINPSDKIRKLENIVKVDSGSNEQAAQFIKKLYSSIIHARVFKAKSIQVAEAAKVIENAQRDINIAFINELSIIFNKMNLSLKDILKASSTKWNFLNFKPGLVGGHCIGVDPYYLAYISKKNYYYPKVILAGREINDKMGSVIVDDFINKIFQKRTNKKKILILGYTFKENCRDIRNTKVEDLFKNLKKKFKEVSIYDHMVIKSEVNKNLSRYFLTNIKNNYFDAIILAVPHKKFLELGKNGLFKYLNKDGKIYDIKHVLKEDKRIFYL
jgi:UDP-N-acetyl-D-galactosamine dehydrogenase